MWYESKPENATNWQVTIIESLMGLSHIPQQEKDIIEGMLMDVDLKRDKANSIIQYLEDNKSSSLDEQFNKIINK